MTGGATVGDGDPNPFWKFSVHCWRKPEVEASCLRLQVDHGLNPNLLLFACWAAAEGLALEPGALAESPAGDWHRNVTAPLRAARSEARRLAPDAENCRQALREAELEVERVEQRLLYRHREQLTAPGREAGGELAALNLKEYVRASACAEGPALHDCVMRLLETCFAEADPAEMREILEESPGTEPGPV